MRPGQLEDAKPPFHAVVFTSLRTGDDEEGYQRAAEEMLALATAQPGFLGIETVRQANGLGISVSYWQDRDSIAGWRQHPRHREIQELGRERWYLWYDVRVCRVDRIYSFESPGR